MIDDVPIVEIRIVRLTESGELTDGDEIPLDVFGGAVPAVGDYLANLWPDNEDEVFEVLDRVFVREFEFENYWLLIVREIDYHPLLGPAFRYARERSLIYKKIEEKRSKEAFAKLLSPSSKKQKKKRRAKSPKVSRARRKPV